MLTPYPTVLGERETLDLVLAGRSLARYGDGEFHLCAGQPAKAQAFAPRLRDRLQMGLATSGDCLIGIPNIRSKTPKSVFWQAQAPRALRFLVSGREYVSSFITRPDSAPWIHTADYWGALELLWQDRDVTLVHGGRHGLTASDLSSATVVHDIVAPERDAWADYDGLLKAIGTPARALLCLGPTATVLAVDLSARGVHAIDLGHVGLFLRKARRGQPMALTPGDRAA